MSKNRHNWWTEPKIKIKAKNLNEELKLRVLKAAFEKYELEELQEMLNIKNNEY